MGAVATTPTATDALLERKKILDENAVLVQELDKKRRELSDVEEALARSKKEHAELTEQHIPQAKKELEDMHADHGRHTSRIQKEVDGHEKRRDDMKAQADDAEARRDKALGEINVVAAELVELELKTNEIKEKRKTEGDAHEKEMADHHASLSAVKTELAKATETLAATRKEDAETKEKNLAEEKRLTTKKRDLDIYHQRLEAEGKKIDPDYKIIV